MLRRCVAERFSGNRCKQIASRSEKHGCTGKKKRNSISGESKSIKSQIWIKFKISLALSVPFRPLSDSWIYRRSVFGMVGGWGVKIP